MRATAHAGLLVALLSVVVGNAAAQSDEWRAYVEWERLAEDLARGWGGDYSSLVCRPPRSVFTASCPLRSEPLVGERWHRYADNALSAVTVSLLSWREDLKRGERNTVWVGVASELGAGEVVDVRLLIVLPDGKVSESSMMQRLSLPPRGRERAEFSIFVPEVARFLVVAELKPRTPLAGTVRSIRKIGYGSPGATVPDAPFDSSCCRVGF